MGQLCINVGWSLLPEDLALLPIQRPHPTHCHLLAPSNHRHRLRSVPSQAPLGFQATPALAPLRPCTDPGWKGPSVLLSILLTTPRSLGHCSPALLTTSPCQAHRVTLPCLPSSLPSGGNCVAGVTFPLDCASCAALFFSPQAPACVPLTSPLPRVASHLSTHGSPSSLQLQPGLQG